MKTRLLLRHVILYIITASPIIWPAWLFIQNGSIPFLIYLGCILPFCLTLGSTAYHRYAREETTRQWRLVDGIMKRQAHTDLSSKELQKARQKLHDRLFGPQVTRFIKKCSFWGELSLKEVPLDFYDQAKNKASDYFFRSFIILMICWPLFFW